MRSFEDAVYGVVANASDVGVRDDDIEGRRNEFANMNQIKKIILVEFRFFFFFFLVECENPPSIAFV